MCFFLSACHFLVQFITIVTAPLMTNCFKFSRIANWVSLITLARQPIKLQKRLVEYAKSIYKVRRPLLSEHFEQVWGFPKWTSLTRSGVPTLVGSLEGSRVKSQGVQILVGAWNGGVLIWVVSHVGRGRQWPVQTCLLGDSLPHVNRQTNRQDWKELP